MSNQQIHTRFRAAIRRIVCAVLCFGLVCCTFFFALQKRPSEPVEAARTSKDVNDDIVECEALLSRLQSDLKEISGQISDLEGQSNAALLQAQLAAEQVAVLQTQIELNESLLQSCDMKLG
ncbi:MAG: hypothetical protein J1E00_03945, partial [Oscillospiraceae bacterium]|nr:hypothetical protein [Oscillospiraceae bacterium]